MRKIKFFKVYTKAHYDDDYSQQFSSVLGPSVSDWIEVDDKELDVGRVYGYLYNKIRKDNGDVKETLTMVEELPFTQDDFHITLEKVMEAEKERAAKFEAEKKKRLEKKAAKKAQTIAEKKALLEQLKKELEG